MRSSLTYRDLLRVALASILLLFGLLLAWRFLAGIATAVLMLLTGLLLAVALSGPVEVLHRRKISRPLATGLILVGTLIFLGVGGYLLLPKFER